MNRHALLLAGLLFILAAPRGHADPNADIDGYCRSRSDSYDTMLRCERAEEDARAEIAKKQRERAVDAVTTCLDAIASWPKDQPCPPERWAEILQNLRDRKPCA